jgi:hypothetical protein
MGNYNPHIPNILGEEWVPIRDEDVTFSPAVNSVELGHQFYLPQAAQVRDGRFYIHELPATPAFYQTALIGVYPRQLEDLSGPIQQVIIPCNNGGITGAGLSLQLASTLAEAVYAPADDKALVALHDAILGQASFFFNVDAYPHLATKRILNVSLLYSGWVIGVDALANNIPFVDPDPGLPTTVVSLRNDSASQEIFFSKFASSNTGYLWQLNTKVNPATNRAATDQQYAVLNLGDINHFWDTAAVSSSVMPWRYVDLQRFQASATNRLHVHMQFQVPTLPAGATAVLNLEYVALRVIYCEENRVVYGGAQVSSVTKPYNNGAFIIPLRNKSFVADPILDSGNYTVTLSWVHPGDINNGSGLDSDFPKLNGLRQLYALPEQRGVQVNIPVPIENHLGETFTKVETQVLPQISLHSSGGPLTAVHSYGRQINVPVYGAVTPEDEIYDDALTGDTVYDQVRFYARRFGNTSVPLEIFGIGGTAGAASITPATFDLLPEIINGWKQVTLTLNPTTTMGTIPSPSPRFRFRAFNELPGNRWEILGACAPALSGIPGNYFNLVPSPNQLYEATYQPPGGAQAEILWSPQGVGSPPVTALTDDDSSDAVLMFAQSMPTITGFTVATATQTLTGIGLDCGLNPCCVPSALLYNRITWPLPVNTGVGTDDFTRTVFNGWGTSSDGHAWTTSGTAADFLVDGTQGRITPALINSSRFVWMNTGGPDQDIRGTVRIADTAESGLLTTGILGRLTDGSNFYSLRFKYGPSSSQLVLTKRVANVDTDLITMTVPQLNPNTAAYRFMRFQIKGNILLGKVWGSNETEPDWMIVSSDTSLTTGNNAGFLARDDTAAATPTNFYYDDFTVRAPDYWFGSYELQRMDTVDTTWQTIMRATGPSTTGFSDYEARVGILSSYRIRGVDVYDFAGPWSSTVTITIPSPGASGGCISQGHVLLFSTNERQDGSSNLAYSSVWEGQVSEDFTFPESSFVQLQAMYNRDFFTAFRPTERGGEQFQRTVLVQAAAISPPTLADFTSLRDMAWDDVSYVCVRDEGGNRWFATVVVPSGRVLHNRKLYLAPVQVIEVTDTPSEADPS